MNAPPNAILLGLLAYTCWALGDASLKFMGNTTLPWHEIVSLNGIGSAATVFTILALQGDARKLRLHNPGQMATLGVLFLAAVFTLLAALHSLPLADYFVISFTTPLIIAGLGALLLKERLSRNQLVAIIAGFIGVVITANPLHVTHGYDNILGYATALLSAALFACVILAIRVLGKTESSESLAFYPALALAAGAIVVGIVKGFVPPQAPQLFFTILSGVLGGLGWRWMATATQRAPASLVAPYQYSQVITGAFIGYLVWGEEPTLNLLAGAVIIAAAGLYLARTAGIRA